MSTVKSDEETPAISLPEHATMRDFQKYVHELEVHHGWLDVDLVHNCFLMGEEVGELFKAVRKFKRYYVETNEPGETEPAGAGHAETSDEREAARAHVGEEIVDVFNYLMAIANRLDIDVEAAFKAKNELNQKRTWGDSQTRSEEEPRH